MADRTTSYAEWEERRKEEVTAVVALLERQEAKYLDLLPTNVSWADFRNAFLVAVQSNNKLLEADRASLFLALQKCAGDGLKPDGREAALVIFGDDSEDEDGNPVPSTAKGKKKVVYMPMVWGLTKLIRNTGNVTSVRCKPVYRGETFVVKDSDGVQTYEHVWDMASTIDRSDRSLIGAYAVISYKDGTFDLEPMDRAAIDKVKASSRSKKGPWLTWYPQMACKVPLRRLSLRVEKSAENHRFFTAIQDDASLKTIDGVGVEDVTAPEQAAIEQDQSIKHEFTADKQKQPVSQPKPKAEVKEAKGKAAPAPTGDPPTGVDGVAPSHSAAGSESAGKGGAGAAASGAKAPPEPETKDGGGEIWAMDEFGDPVENPEPMTAMEFANWFASRLFKCREIEALREHNADAIEQAGQHSFKALGIIEQSISRERQRQQDDRDAARLREMEKAGVQAKAADLPPDEKVLEGEVMPKPEPTSTKRVAMAVPKTPKGAPHWPNYTAAAKAEIAKLATESDIEGWKAVNFPVYKAHAAEFAIDATIRDRRAAIRAAGGNAETNTQFITRIRNEVNVLDSVQAIDAWSQGAIRPVMIQLRGTDPDTFALALNVIDERRMAVEDPPV